MSASPRPTYDCPTLIRYDQVTRHVWGDEESGRVIDWIYVSSAKIHQLVFSLPFGGSFRHSENHRTIFAADELYYVVSGTFVISNPETGEVHRVNSGEAVYFGKDTWHHGFNYGTEPLRVLEFFAPPPSQGTSSAYAKTKPNLTEFRYRQDEWIGKWPKAESDINSKFKMRVLREADIIWHMGGNHKHVLTGLILSTEHLTVGKVFLLPGQQSEIEVHGGDESLFLLQGKLTISVDTPDAKPWYELNPGDGFYLPQGTRHQYQNISNEPAVALFGVAPYYLPR